MSELDRSLKSYVANPTKVRAGRIEKVYYEEDNEEFPFTVWINGLALNLSDEICEDIEPKVGDYLVMPKGEEESPCVLPPRVFHLFYVEIGNRAEAASTAGIH